MSFRIGIDTTVYSLINALSNDPIFNASSLQGTSINPVLNLSNDDVLSWDISTLQWIPRSISSSTGEIGPTGPQGEIGSTGPGIDTIGLLDSETKSVNGAVINNNSIVFQTADDTSMGMIGIGYQTLPGAKTMRNDNNGSVKGIGMYNADTTAGNGITFNFETDTTGTGAQQNYATTFFGVQFKDHNHETVTAVPSWSTYIAGTQKTIWSMDEQLRLFTDGTLTVNKLTCNNGIEVGGNLNVVTESQFQSFNSMGANIIVDTACTGTSVFGNNLASNIVWSANMDSGIFGLGLNSVAYVGTLQGQNSSTIDTINQALAGAGNNASVPGSTISNFNMYNAAGIVDTGDLTVTNLRGFYCPSIFGSVPVVNQWGVDIQSTTAENNFKKSVCISTITNKVSDANVGLEIGSDKDLVLGNGAAIYLGNKTTDGTWRYIRNGNDLNFDRLESGVWVTKNVISG